MDSLLSTGNTTNRYLLDAPLIIEDGEGRGPYIPCIGGGGHVVWEKGSGALQLSFQAKREKKGELLISIR